MLNPAALFALLEFIFAMPTCLHSLELGCSDDKMLTVKGIIGVIFDRNPVELQLATQNIQRNNLA